MKRVLIFIFTFIIVSCNANKGTSTGNPLVSISMTSSGSAATVVKSFFHKVFTLFVPQSVAKAPPPLMSDANNNSLAISSFWISLGEIEFKYSETVDAGEVDGSEVEFTGPFTVDMFSNTPDVLASGALINSDFRRIKYKLSRVSTLPTGAPNGLSGNAVFISGTVNGNSFTFTTQSEVEMSVSGANLVAAQQSDILLLQIKLANLVKKIDFSAVTAGAQINENSKFVSATALCPLIDPSARDIYTCMIEGFSTEGNLGRDLNGDGEFEASEPTVK